VNFCIYCGGTNDEDATFCIHCGERLYHEQDRVRRTPFRRLSGRVALTAFAILSIAAMVLVFSLKNRTNPNTPALAVKSPTPRPNAESVLTIVGMNARGSPIVQGSGFILTADGLAASNYHVLRGAMEATAQCCGGRTFDIRSIEGVDFKRDLITFQLWGPAGKPQNLPAVTLGSSQNLSVGDKVIAIGSPEGFENTVSDGILSAIREDESARYLQITAPISPGSSGGPVLDSEGRVVGVATAQLNAGQNLNFAIAIENLRPLMNEHYAVSLPELRSIVSYARRGRRAVSPAPEEQASTSADTVRNTDMLTGQFEGVVHNQTAEQSAEFGIIVDESSGVITGCMGVKQPLFGSGPVTGFRDGVTVSFFVTSAIGQIMFQGDIAGADISGTYSVSHEAAPTETGTFTLHKVNSKGLGKSFDTTKCPTDAEIHEN
jgi:S1-C subfamily serine protease